MERDLFLARVARAVLTSVIPDPPHTGDRLPALDSVELTSLFRSRAMSVSAVVHGPVSRHGAPRAVVGIASGHDATNFMAWDDLPVPGVSSALAAAGLDRVEAAVPTGEERAAHVKGYQRLDLGVTGADLGLAESGSIVLHHGPGRPRMASLVPEVHVALLEVGRLARSLAHWAEERPASPGESANLVVITGPSRTGDIEMQLSLGVHGPRHLHVVLVT
ncbi:MAG: LUD domain-containing protein [Actinobacteria bacterium]|nr:LUD domain-containing protein [Actinomycetota bacterium]